MGVFSSGSHNSYDAQLAANSANIEMNEQNNLWNWEIAKAQNEWNIQQWKEQNKYNDPSAQMERYMKAGINPLWAISNGDPGNAQQLTAASPAPMTPGHVEPAYDVQYPQRIANILGAAQNVSNNALDFYKAFLESEDVKTRRGSYLSQLDLNRADIGFKKAQTQGQQIFNNLNAETYGVQVETKSAELREINGRIDNLRSQTNLNDKQQQLLDESILNAQETRKQIIAQTGYVATQSYSLIQEVAQGWKRLAIEQQNANTGYMGTYYGVLQGAANTALGFAQFGWQQTSDIKKFENMSVDQLLKFYDEKRGYLGRILGNLDFTDLLSHGFSDHPTTERQLDDVFRDIFSVGRVLQSRVENEPWNQEAIKAFDAYSKGLLQLPQPPFIPYSFGNGSSILNPSNNWQK